MTDRFQVPSQVHARRFDDEVVVLHIGIGKYFALDAAGATIWDQLTTGKTPEEVVAAIVTEYEVDEASARDDVLRLARELVAAGLLERAP